MNTLRRALTALERAAASNCTELQSRSVSRAFGCVRALLDGIPLEDVQREIARVLRDDATYVSRKVYAVCAIAAALIATRAAARDEDAAEAWAEACTWLRELNANAARELDACELKRSPSVSSDADLEGAMDAWMIGMNVPGFVSVPLHLCADEISRDVAAMFRCSAERVQALVRRRAAPHA